MKLFGATENFFKAFEVQSFTSTHPHTFQIFTKSVTLREFSLIFNGVSFLPRHFFSTCRMIIILPIESYSGNDSEGSYDPNDILFKPETAQ